MSGDRDPFVSVLVPVYNDNERLPLTLECLERQTYPNYEVVVIDNGSDVSPEPIVALFPHARLTTESTAGSYAARNQGMRVAKGDWFAFTDGDCAPVDIWIEAGIRRLQEIGGKGVVAGYTNRFAADPERPTATELYEIVTIPDPEARARDEGFGITGNLFAHRDVFDAVGEFDERLKSLGDREWGQRARAAGFPVDYAGAAHVETPARHRLKQHLTKHRRLTGGAKQLRRREAEVRRAAKAAGGAPAGDAAGNSAEANGAQTSKQSMLGSFRNLPWNRVLPPFEEMRTLTRDERLTGPWQRFQVAWISVLTHYTRGVEHVRLALGGEAERR